MATDTTKTNKNETVEATKSVIAPNNADGSVAEVPKGPRNYLVMMLLAVLMLPSGLARAYRGEKNGWTRFWVYVGATGACFIPFLNIVGLIVLAGLSVWGAIDVFKLYKEKLDADGEPLVSSPRDEKFAKGMYIYFIVGLITFAVVAVIFVIVFSVAILSGSNRRIDNIVNPGNSRPYYYDTNTYER